MNRIEAKLADLKKQQKRMLSPYITAGDPTPADTVELMHALVAAGADILEIGIPFSDPMAEGPVIQAAMERALAQGVTCDHVFAMIESFRQQDKTTPIVIMGYLNPIEFYGYERFAKRAVEAGADGTILVDLPPEESESLSHIWKAHKLYSIYLCSPTTTAERMVLINRYGQGYHYYVSLKGVTGSDELDLKSLHALYQQRKAQTSLPLMVGFGIKTSTMAANVASFADGVIVGAALINQIEHAHNNGEDIYQAAKSLLSGMRQAIDIKENKHKS